MASARIPERAPLAEQVPAAVEFDLDLPQPFLIGFERVRVEAVGFLAVAQLVLLGDEPLDPVCDGLVGHPDNATPAALRR